MKFDLTSINPGDPAERVRYPSGEDFGSNGCVEDRRRRKAVVKEKQEMCQYILDGEVCPFGDLCRFAHREDELRLQTLLERHEKGLIDICTYRTRPCLHHVTTGAW